MHETSRRILSVLLQSLEGLHGRSKSLLVCATNRRRDLDPALLSRFDLSVTFPMPDRHTRAAVFHSYAQQLSPDELHELSILTDGFSCRDIVESALDAERRWAARLLRLDNTTTLPQAPDVNQYMASVHYRIGSKQVFRPDPAATGI
jgi:ATP-dependent 26S proteasome regulatory subunit